MHRTKPTLAAVLTQALLNALVYNCIEVALLVSIAVLHIQGLVVWAPVLWLSFTAAALWTVLASTNECQEESCRLVLDREVYITDYMVAVLLLGVLGYQTIDYGLQYSAIFVLASLQNLRYTVLAYGWLVEEAKEKS